MMSDYLFSIVPTNYFREVYHMNKSLFTVLIAVIGGIAAITAAVTAFLIFKEKQRRDEEELEHYLDSSIQ